MTSYTQLTQVQRYQIYALRKALKSQQTIAEVIGVHPSTISRELRRNKGLKGYRPKQADQLAQARRALPRSRIQPEHWLEVERLLRLYWSPEQISNRLYEEQGFRISHEWIYQHVYRDNGIIPNQTMIDERPNEANERSRIGDWEGDTIVGKNHKGVLISLVDRKSRYTVLGHSASKRKEPVANDIIDRMTPFKKTCKTITYDNGREFSDHERIGTALNADMYFAHPYASWERGTNENTNGLVRQFFPKGTCLLKVSEQKLQSTMDRLNHRPRKTLNWRTPHEVFSNSNTNLTVALQS